MPRPSSALLPRPRLRQKLEARLCAGDGTFARKLTLLSAPAGFGKTTLLAQWLAHADLPVAWLSLDKSDDEPSRFLRYLFAALQGVDQTLGRAALARLRSAQAPSPQPLLAQLINQVSQLRRPLILVVDDYHLIDDPQIHQALAFLLQQLPPTVHLVISSRATPPWPLARLRALGQMVEMRAADLRFTREESTAFLNEVMDLGLLPQEIASLDARAEGWITALRLAALALDERQDKASFIEAFGGSNRFVLDYLLEEVLERQPGAVRQFLLQTSILDRLCAPLCDALVEIGEGRSEISQGTEQPPATDDRSSQPLLEYLEVANLFLIPLDDERRWYRYHHLFADLLHMRLQQQVAGQVPRLHERASLWYEQQGLLVDAVRHAQRAGDATRVARLVAANGLAMMENSELRTMERGLGALARQALDPSPWLQVAHAWILVFVGDLERAQAVLQAIEEAQAVDGDSGGPKVQSLAGHLEAVRSFACGVRGDAAQAVVHAQQALALLPPEDLWTRSWANVSRAIEYSRLGQMEMAGEALARAVELSREIGPGHVTVMILCTAAVFQMGRGELAQAAETCHEALRLAAEYASRAGRPLPVAGYAHLCLARVLHEWNHLQDALHHVEIALRLCEQWGEPQLLVGAYVHAAGLRQTVGDAEGALEAIRKAKRAAASLSPGFAARATISEALIRLRQGDVSSARHLAQAWQDGPDRYLDRSDSLFATLVQARIDVVQGHFDEALARLGRVQSEAEATGSLGLLLSALLLEANALDAQGKADLALQALEEALAFAEPREYVRTFVDEGVPVAALLQRAADRGLRPAYTARLLAAFPAEERPAPGTLAPGAPQPLLEPLTARERAVLQLLPTPLTHAEMAQELFISLNTLRSHLKNIYGKLDAHSRMEAVQRARHLTLLD